MQQNPPHAKERDDREERARADTDEEVTVVQAKPAQGFLQCDERADFIDTAERAAPRKGDAALVAEAFGMDKAPSSRSVGIKH